MFYGADSCLKSRGQDRSPEALSSPYSAGWHGRFSPERKQATCLDLRNDPPSLSPSIVAPALIISPMEELSIPGWIWFVAGFMLVAVIIMFALKHQHDDASSNSIPKSRFDPRKH